MYIDVQFLVSYQAYKFVLYNMTVNHNMISRVSRFREVDAVLSKLDYYGKASPSPELQHLD